MKASRFLPPYDKAGRTTFLYTQGKSGNYLIKENGKVVYVGYSGTNLYKTMYRHFQYWSSWWHSITYADRLKSKKYTVKVILCGKKQAAILERVYILLLKPRDNEEKYQDYEMTAKDREILKQVSRAAPIPTDKTPF